MTIAVDMGRKATNTNKDWKSEADIEFTTRKQPLCLLKKENSVDPDQLAQKPASLDLHCFQICI